ncbi:hypothetical protein ABZV58_10515 [Nocardia sp. NPDC004654]|uniref:hypothetical protein n=1 Tax=Nocardia sp. NPDC004654 TaxID=3154776 RepID=UPI0033A313CE
MSDHPTPSGRAACWRPARPGSASAVGPREMRVLTDLRVGPVPLLTMEWLATGGGLG